MANGNVITNLGDSVISGLGAINAHPTKIGTQVADVTKPLAAATEAVDGGRTIILHRTGGIVKKLSPESEKMIRDIIKAEKGPEVILERRGGAFTFDIDVQSDEASKWETPKKTVRSTVRQSSDMDKAWRAGIDSTLCGMRKGTKSNVERAVQARVFIGGERKPCYME